MIAMSEGHKRPDPDGILAIGNAVEEDSVWVKIGEEVDTQSGEVKSQYAKIRFEELRTVRTVDAATGRPEDDSDD